MDVVRHQPNQGWIEVIVGSMFSGKSEELIRRLRRAQIARQKVQIFKPSLDRRYADDAIVSHSEMRIPSRAVESSRALLDLNSEPIRPALFTDGPRRDSSRLARARPPDLAARRRDRSRRFAREC